MEKDKNTLSTIRTMPIRIKVESMLRNAILSGTFKSGQELSLTDLSAQLGVSRTPIREALQTLEKDGLVQLRMNRGSIVTSIDSQFIREYYELRTLLESAAAYKAASCNSDFSELVKLQNDISKKKNITEEAYKQYNELFHTTIWKLADNKKMYALLSNIWTGTPIGKKALPKDYMQDLIKSHDKIVECLLNHDAEGARKCMAEHMDINLNTMLKNFGE